MIVQSFEASLLSATMPKIWPKMKKCLDQLSLNLFPMKPPKPETHFLGTWSDTIVNGTFSICMFFFLFLAASRLRLLGSIQKWVLKCCFVHISLSLYLFWFYSFVDSVGQSYEITNTILIIIAFCKTLCRLETIFWNNFLMNQNECYDI